MLNVISPELISQIEAVDSATGPADGLDAIRFGEPAELIDRLVSAQRVVTSVIVFVCLVGLTAPLGIALAFTGSSLPLGVRMAAPALTLALPFLLLLLMRVFPIWSDRRARPRLDAGERPLYFEGASPAVGRRMVFGHNFLFLVERGTVTSWIPWSELSVAAIDVRGSGALIVLSRDDTFFAVATAGRVGGALSLRWSFDGLLGVGKLRRALTADLESRGVLVAEVDWSTVG